MDAVMWDTEDVAACVIAAAADAMGPAVRQCGGLDADASQLCITCSLHSKCFACGIRFGIQGYTKSYKVS